MAQIKRISQSGDSPKLTVVDTEGLDGSERSGTTGSAEPVCPNSGSWGCFSAAVPGNQLGLETRAKGGNSYHPCLTEIRRHGRHCGTRTYHRHDNRRTSRVRRTDRSRRNPLQAVFDVPVAHRSAHAANCGTLTSHKSNSPGSYHAVEFNSHFG